MLFCLRVRPLLGGCRDYFVEADNLAQAERVGRKWCETQAGWKYVSVDPAIVADASILPVEATQPLKRIGK
jgi:hypothetical protein